MKSWKKNKRHRKHNKYKNYIMVKCTLDRDVIRWLRRKSQETGKPIAKLVSEAILEYVKQDKEGDVNVHSKQV